MGWTEAIAVAFGFGYILLAIRQQRACWIAGGISTALFIPVFIEARLPWQAGLQLVYVALAVYGWVAWRPGSMIASRPQRWTWTRHFVLLVAVAVAAAASLWPGPYPLGASAVTDSVGAWASIAATWLLARRVIDAWCWWVVIDLGLASLFLFQGLPFTAALYAAYALLALVGWRTWRRGLSAA